MVYWETGVHRVILLLGVLCGILGVHRVMLGVLCGILGVHRGMSRVLNGILVHPPGYSQVGARLDSA